MKLTTAVATALLGASAVVAAPGSVKRSERASKRAFSRKTNPMIPANNTESFSELATTQATSYSSNWAGGVLIGSGYTSVTGTITVPTPKAPSGGKGTYSASAWVGIDGDTCSSAILQTGLDFTVSGSSVSYDAWYEWYPDYAYDFSGITFKAGDSVTMTVTATSKTSGSAVITNNSSGKTVTHTFTGGVDGTLCETNAEWIVEDYESGSSLVPLANWGTVTFTGASAKSGSSSVGTSGAQIINMKQGNTVYSSCSASGSQVSCTYE